MADDPRLTQAYRSLPAEEPPPALDDAIRAAARRATSARPRSSRWQVPVSIAAVLVLAFGIALHLEREQPILDDAAPGAMRATETPLSAAKPEAAPAVPGEAPAAKTDMAPPVGATQGVAPGKRPGEAPSTASRAMEKMAPRAEAPVRERKSIAVPAEPAAPAADAARPAFVPSPSPAADATRPIQTPPSPAQNLAPPVAPPSVAPAAAPPPAPVPAAPAAPRPSAPTGSAPAEGAAFAPDPAARRAGPLRAAPGVSSFSKEEAAGAVAPTEKRRGQEMESPERWLERIAELRRQGRDAEADTAWAAFRRAYPGYRVPAGMLEKVQPR